MWDLPGLFYVHWSCSRTKWLLRRNNVPKWTNNVTSIYFSNNNNNKTNKSQWKTAHSVIVCVSQHVILVLNKPRVTSPTRPVSPSQLYLSDAAAAPSVATIRARAGSLRVGRERRERTDRNRCDEDSRWGGKPTVLKEERKKSCQDTFRTTD